jgi:hypothetical protein
MKVIKTNETGYRFWVESVVTTKSLTLWTLPQTKDYLFAPVTTTGVAANPS